MDRHNLYMLRCDNKLTKGEMAAKTGVSRTTYSLIEKGDRDGSQEFWSAVQREFNVPDSEMYLLMKKGQSNAEQKKSSSPTDRD